MFNTLKLMASSTILFGVLSLHSDELTNWQLGPFKRIDDMHPILTTRSDTVFYCPIQKKNVFWEAEHVFNPGAVVREGKVYLFYRAEDDYGIGIGYHTSRLGLATSTDGIHFERMSEPVLFPDSDDQSDYEFPGGCEDPRIVETEEGTYVMTYTQWNRQVAVLAIATSTDLMHWKKQGYAFEDKLSRQWSKSGSIVCRLEEDRLIATRIHGKYWMYWGEKMCVAISDDLISWDPLVDENGNLISILEPRNGKFDSVLVEAGPPAIIMNEGILLVYNGKNSVEEGDADLAPEAYCAGQVLLDLSNPIKVRERSDSCFLMPEAPYEIKGQYQGGTVFAQGLVHFRDKWFLYYGAADSAIGAAVCE